MMLPIGNWIFSLKPAPPPPPKKPFDQFWESLGKFVKKASPIAVGLFLLYVGYQAGIVGGSIGEFLNDFSIFSRQGQSDEDLPIQGIPGEKAYAVVVASAETEPGAKEIITRLRQANIATSQFFASGKYIVYIGDLRTRAQAETALSKVQNKGFPNARIVP